jgi:hypothetical protein
MRVPVVLCEDARDAGVSWRPCAEITPHKTPGCRSVQRATG